MTTGRCMNVKVIDIAAAVVNVVSDFVILLLPQGMIWKLRLDIKKRLGVSLIFATALLACASAATRLYYAVLLYHSDDVTWYGSLMVICMFPELGLGIVVCCLPTVPKFFRTLGEAPLFSRIGSILYSLLGITQNNSSNRSSDLNTKSMKRECSSDGRLDSYDQPVEEQGLQTQIKKQSGCDITIEEVELAL